MKALNKSHSAYNINGKKYTKLSTTSNFWVTTDKHKFLLIAKNKNWKMISPSPKI